VAGPPDALQAGGHRRRGLHLDDQVDGAHVDAELQRAGGHEGRELARLEAVLDLEALLAGDGSVVGPHQLLAGQLVEPPRQALGQPAGVHEDEGGAVPADEVEQRHVDGGPDGRAHLGVPGGRARHHEVANPVVARAVPIAAGRAGGRAGGRAAERLAHLPHVLHGYDDLDVELLAHAGVDHGDRALLAVGPPASQEAGQLLERALGGGETDALGR